MNNSIFAMLPGIDRLKRSSGWEELTKNYDADTRQRFLLIYQEGEKTPKPSCSPACLAF